MNPKKTDLGSLALVISPGKQVTLRNSAGALVAIIQPQRGAAPCRLRILAPPSIRIRREEEE